MEIPTSQIELAELLERFGAPDPESWAASQINEGIPQLQRFLFLRQAWKSVLSPDNTKWVQDKIEEAERNSEAPFSGLGSALKLCVQQGVPPDALTEIARNIQVGALFNFCYLLDDPAFRENELQEFGWGLFQVDEEDNPVPPRIGTLHESVLELDPTGREMRPIKE